MPAALSSFARYVRPEVQECPEIMILDAVLQAGIEFCKRTRVIKQVLPLVTVASQAAYSLTTQAGTEIEEILSIYRGNNDRLYPSSFAEFSNNSMNVNVSQPRYYYLDALGVITLGDIPEGVETLTVTVKLRPKEDATTLPDELLSRYRTKIAAGAKAMLMAMAAKPWSNPQNAGMYAQMFEGAIEDANLRDAKGGARKPLRTKLQVF